MTDIRLIRRAIDLPTYVLGRPETRFALIHYPVWRLRRFRHGVVIGPLGFWWGR